ncbi:uncharacterized protein [Nicotiana sylvestris]|uniref:uncharacterized protein n=1 Tax=Nicotiana sylvestris TaxID=4096 RepID=UPI00388C7B2A
MSNPPVLVPPELGRPLFLYLTVLENSFGCVLGQQDVTGKKEQGIYYLRKKFTSYEAKYTLLERTCCALTWVSQKLRHYLQAYTTYLITRLDPLKYIFQKPMPMGRLAKWQILLTECDIVYVTRTSMKAQALADHLAKNPVDDECQPLSTYFPDEEVNSVEHYPATARLQFLYTNNTAEYEACIMGMNMGIDQGVEELLIMGDSDLIIRQAQGEWETRDVKLIPYRQRVEDLGKRFKSIEFRYIPCCHNELADALATLASMLPYPGNAHIDPLEIQIRERHGYCNTVEAEPNSFDEEICEQFKITHRNSTPYRPKANGVVEAANKNIKKILRKMIQSSRQWHEKLHFALLGYRTIVRTSVGATPYLLVYSTKAVIPAEVEIPSLRIIVEAEIEDSEWVKARLEQLTLIDEKRMAAEAKGKFAPNWKGPYIIRKILPRGPLYLGDIEGNDPEAAMNADAVQPKVTVQKQVQPSRQSMREDKESLIQDFDHGFVPAYSWINTDENLNLDWMCGNSEIQSFCSTADSPEIRVCY